MNIIKGHVTGMMQRGPEDFIAFFVPEGQNTPIEVPISRREWNDLEMDVPRKLAVEFVI